MNIRTLSYVLLALLLAFLTLGQQSDPDISGETVQQKIIRLQETIDKQDYSFTVGENPALNYTLDELCGFRAPEGWQQQAMENNLQTVQPEALRAAPVSLPSAWDWRNHNGVSPVKDQGACGSCWAFGTVGTFESLLLIQQNLLEDCSEQHLVSCNTEGWGCNGGFWAHDMLMDPGAVLEADFPYVASDVPCGGPYTYPYQLGGWTYVDGDNAVPPVELIKEAIYNYGPVCAAVFVGDFFQSYTGGIFDAREPRPSGGCGCDGTPPPPNHAIMLVGWDDSEGVWILKNSWGTDWGMQGYMLIRYGSNQVGYAAVAVY
jgi:C1A family cysteine protease